ncbi:hypothetical protein ACFQV4_33035 [Streptomyces thermocarboxydus]
MNTTVDGAAERKDPAGTSSRRCTTSTAATRPPCPTGRPSGRSRPRG